MGFDFVCDFKLDKCIKKLGIEERGSIQRLVTDEVINLSEPYIPLDVAEKYENPGQLKDSGHPEEDHTVAVWKTPYARRWYYEKANFQGAPQRGNNWVYRMLQNGGLEAIQKSVRDEIKKRK